MSTTGPKRAALLLCLVGLHACQGTRSVPIALPFPLELEFEGAQSLSQEDLAARVRAELVRLEVAQPDKAAVDDAAFALELAYRARGHADVRVDYRFEPAAGGPARAHFVIEEGPVARVKAIQIEGAQAVEPERVRSFLEPEDDDGIYDEERLRGGLEALRRLYLERGHLLLEIQPLETTFDETRENVTLTLRLHEGPVFRVREVEVRGGVPELEAREHKLEFRFQGGLFRRTVVPELENALVEDYRRAGYKDVELQTRAHLDETSGAVELTVELAPGPRVTLEHFRIEGNERTKDAAILELVGIARGTTYDAEAVRHAFRELYATGLFESVTLEVEGQGAERTLVIRVVEARSVQIRVEPGWGSYEGPRVLLGIQENNFQGRGQVLSLQGTASPRARSARLTWKDRNFLGSSFTSELSFFAEQREEPAFEFLRRGFGFFLQRALGPEWSVTFGYEFRPTNVDESNLSAPLSLDFDPSSDSEVAALSASIGLDTRDNLLLPTRGSYGRARVEWADAGLGSDTEFVRAQLEFARLAPWGDQTVLAASARTGVVAPFGRTDFLPLPERFFNGGENSVRSYREDELPAEGVDGTALGGEAATTLNLELRRSLGGNLAGALFADFGNVVAEVQDYLRFEGFHAGLGFGLRYMLPIGPVRLDLGFNPDRASGEDAAVLHFSVGFPF